MSLSNMVDVADKLVYFQTINHFRRIKLDRERNGDEWFREGKERKYKEWEREMGNSKKKNMEKVEGMRWKVRNSDRGERGGRGHFRPGDGDDKDGRTTTQISSSLPLSADFSLPFIL